MQDTMFFSHLPMPPLLELYNNFQFHKVFTYATFLYLLTITYFYILTIMINASTNIAVQVIHCCSLISFPFDIYSAMGLMDHFVLSRCV